MKTPSVVFLVDDNEMYLQILTQVIHQLPDHEKMDIKTFNSGEEVIEALHEEPDLIILDYNLKNKFDDTLNGLDTLKKIKQISSKLKVIMLSAQENVEEAVNCMKEGAHDYIVKNQEAFEKLKNAIMALKV